MKTLSTMFRTLLGGGLALLFSLVIISHAGAQTCVPPPSGLVSWWPGDGNFDDIGDANAGSDAGGTTFTTGKVGKAFSFNGANNSFITLPNSANMLPASNQLTVDTWIKPDFTVSNQWDNILAKRDGCDSSGNSYNFGINKGDPNDVFGAIAFAMSSPDGSIIRATSEGTTVPNDGQFHHVAATYDGSVMRVYLDGQLVGQASRTGPILGTTSAPVISHHGGTCSTRAAAAIDEVEFFDRALPQSDIQAIFDAGSAGKCKAATGLDHFKCYKVKGEPPNVAVEIEDQFGIEPGVLVKRPTLFCNPVDKNGEGIRNPAAHLTCYKIKADGEKRDVVAMNQFGEQTLEVKKPELLCVPSNKIDVIPGQDDDEEDDEEE